MNDSSIPTIPIISSPGLTRISAEPQSRVASAFGGIMRAAKSTVSGVAESLMGIDPDYAALIKMQIDAQRELQLVSMISNVEKSKHETQMAAIRNIRVSG